MVASYVQKLTRDRLEQRRSTLRIAEEWAETSSSRHSVSSVPAITAVSTSAVKSSHAALVGAGGVLTGLAVAAAAATIYFRMPADAPRAMAGVPVQPAAPSTTHEAAAVVRETPAPVVDTPRTSSESAAPEPAPPRLASERARLPQPSAPERPTPTGAAKDEQDHEAGAEASDSEPSIEATLEEPSEVSAIPAAPDTPPAAAAPVVTASLPLAPAVVPSARATAASGPRLLASKLGHRQLLTNPSSKAVRIPTALEHSGQTFTATVNVCVDSRGDVSKVSVLRSAGPALDPQIVELVSHWKYRPLMEAGTPTPFCYPVNYQVEPQ
jgi:TonB family protein